MKPLVGNVLHRRRHLAIRRARDGAGRQRAKRQSVLRGCWVEATRGRVQAEAARLAFHVQAAALSGAQRLDRDLQRVGAGAQALAKRHGWKLVTQALATPAGGGGSSASSR